MAASARDSKRDQIRVSENRNPTSCCSSSVGIDASMVEMELDAARALTDFAQLAMQESERNGGESSRIWGNKGRRSRKKVKEELGMGECAKKKKRSNFKSALELNLVQDSTVENNRVHKKLRKSVTARRIKDEQDIELLKSTPQCSTSCVSSGGGRSRHQLTEAEKEAKQLRRVLANRESARQTIRRRQALCEELSRKAAELTKENECMKLERELIKKQYLLLEDTNKHLKVQMAKVVKTEKEVHLAKPAEAVSSSEKQQPLCVYNNPAITPFIWPPVVHSPNSINTQPTLPDTTVPACNLELADERGSIPWPPFYIMPCPWFFPFGNGLYPHPIDSFGFKQEASVVNPCEEGSSAKVTDDIQNHQPSSSRKLLTKGKCANNLPDTTARLAHCEENQLGYQPSGLNPTPPLLKSSDTTTNKCDDILNQDPPSKVESDSCTSDHIAVGYSENMKGHNIYQKIKMGDPAAAAEARKRRKELTKQKNTNGRYQIQC